jgi:hypothetical protein
MGRTCITHGNDSVNTFLRKRTRMEKSKNCWKRVFSVDPC